MSLKELMWTRHRNPWSGWSRVLVGICHGSCPVAASLALSGAGLFGGDHQPLLVSAAEKRKRLDDQGRGWGASLAGAGGLAG